jgi:DNA polymerase-3 subunit gamma/tau
MPSQSKKKVYVIDEVHMLTNEAFNALLKTLEEPPAHALFILCTTQPEKLPPTIVSRCQRIDFNLAKDEEIVRSLSRIVKGEKLKVDKKTLFLVAQKAEGSFRDAAKILQGLSFSGKRISFKKAQKELEKEGMLAKELLKIIAQKDQQKALKVIDQAVNKGVDLKYFIQQILFILRDILLNLIGIEKKKVDQLGFSQNEVKKLITLFDKAGRSLRGSQIPQLSLEMAVIDYFERDEHKELEVSQATQPASGNLQSKWQKALELVKKDNHSIEALLKSTKPVKIKDNKLEIEVFYQFHYDELQKENKKKLVEKSIKQVFGKKINIKYLMKGK